MMERPPTNAPPADAIEAPWSGQSFRALFQQVIDGSEDAARRLHEQYGPYIAMAVRRKLPPRLRSKYDSLDFVQDVWLSFFRLPERAFESPEHLIGYLVRMAKNKLTDVRRDRLDAAKHAVCREEPLGREVECQERQEVFARDGTPSEAAISHEMWERMVAGQPPVFRRVLLMLRAGYSQQEVAERLTLCTRTVQRILSRAHARAKR
jgi:RNA polymerase sigma-70 factor (ECF subfamily)